MNNDFLDARHLRVHGDDTSKSGQQRIHHGADAPTYIELPEVDADTYAP